MRSSITRRIFLVAVCIFSASAFFPSAVAESQVPPPKGLRVLTAGHSFHVWMPGLLAELAEKAGIVGSGNLAGIRNEAIDRLIAGLEKKRVMNTKEREIVAYHESGHAIVATETDSLFNSGTSSVVSVIVDTTAPSLTITSRKTGAAGAAIPNYTTVTLVYFSFTKSDADNPVASGIASTTCQLDGGTAAACGTPW